MKQKIILPGFLAAVAGLLFVALYSLAGTTDIVTATVTTQNISVSLDQTSFDYGTVPAGNASSTLALWSGAGIIATNDGNVTEDFDIYGADTTNWTLAGTAGSENYVHKFCNDTDNDCATPPTNYTALTTTPQTFKTGIVATSGTAAFQLQITTPTVTATFTSQSAAVTVQASAS